MNKIDGRPVQDDNLRGSAKPPFELAFYAEAEAVERMGGLLRH